MDMIGDLFSGQEERPSSDSSPERDRKRPPGAVFFAIKPDAEARQQG